MKKIEPTEWPKTKCNVRHIDQIIHTGRGVARVTVHAHTVVRTRL